MTKPEPAQDGFLERIVFSLLPYFAATLPDLQDARHAIVGALTGYAARTRAEILEAAQIVAYSFTALDSLGEAAKQDVSLPMRLRLRGQAIALNRSKKQCQTSLADSLCYDAVEAAPLRAEPAPIRTAAPQRAPAPAVAEPEAAPPPPPPVEDQCIAALTTSEAMPNQQRTAAAPVPHAAAPAVRLPGASTAAMLQAFAAAPTIQGVTRAAMPQGAAAAAMLQGAAFAPGPSATPLTQKQKNNAAWASVMGQVINELKPNGRPAP